MTTESTLRAQDGVVTATPADYPRAVSLVREDRLRGLWIRSDFLDGQHDAPTVDLSLLETIPFLEDFGMIASLAFVPAMRRIAYVGFETVVDGDLTPLLSTKTLRDAGFADKRHHSHTLEEIKALLGRVAPEAGDERE